MKLVLVRFKNCIKMMLVLMLMLLMMSRVERPLGASISDQRRRHNRRFRCRANDDDVRK